MASLFILKPLFAILLLSLPLRKLMERAAPYLASLLFFAQAMFVLFAPVSFWSLDPLPAWFSFPIAVDHLTLLMLLSIAVVAFCSLILGLATIRDAKKRFDFTNLTILAVAGMNGIVLVSDLFSLYIFLEIVAVASFILIALHKDHAALEGAFKYLVLSAIATAMMLSSIALLMLVSGGTSFASVAAALKTANNFYALLAVALFMGGLMIKGGLVPFHGWLPDAYSSAPASVSVLLGGIVTKTTGVYTIIRLVTAVFGFTPALKSVLLAAGALSVVAGALLALGQKDFKRMLAFSSISQVGYIILGLGAGTPLGIAGAAFHLFNHAIFKSQLFLNAAAVEEQTGTRDMDAMGGLMARMPVTGFTSLIAMFSTVGIPPLSGFWSKLIIIIALWSAGLHGYALIAVAASILTLAYFLSLQRRIFFGKLAAGFENLREAPAGVVFPAVLLALATVAIGVFFPLVLNTFILPIAKIFG